MTMGEDWIIDDFTMILTALETNEITEKNGT